MNDPTPFTAAREFYGEDVSKYRQMYGPQEFYGLAKECIDNGGPHPTNPLIAIQVDQPGGGQKIYFTRSSFDAYKAAKGK